MWCPISARANGRIRPSCASLLQEIQRRRPRSIWWAASAKPRQNLAVVDVTPANETRAAGVPLFVNATVKNFGPDTARNVQLKVRTDFYDPQSQLTATPEQLRPKTDELPTVLIDEIEPGQSVTRSVQVFFPKPGQHVVDATLQDDPVAVDNRRWCVMDFPESEPVLLVDGSPQQLHAFFLQSVFEPGGRANTGVRPEINTPAFLRDALPEILQARRAAVSTRTSSSSSWTPATSSSSAAAHSPGWTTSSGSGWG